MNCFNHPKVPAVGRCASCGKGLCHDCIAIVKNGLACKGTCESRAELINELIDTRPIIFDFSRAMAKQRLIGLIILAITALMFAFWFYYSLTSGITGYALTAVGLIFAGMAIVEIHRNRL